MIKTGIRILTKNIWYIILFISLLFFLEITKDVFAEEIIHLDVFTHKLLVDYLRSDHLTHVMKFITNFGSGFILILIVALLLICVKRKRFGIYAGVNLSIITIGNILLKNIVKRQRPIGINLITETGFSFPSGHAMVSTAFYGLLIYLTYTKINNKKWKTFICSILTFLILSIDISRVYLGVHYASDVIGGTLLSVCYLILFIQIIPKIINVRKFEDFMKNTIRSFKYAFTGIYTGIKIGRNMKIHIVIMLSVILLGFIFHISATEWIACVFAFSLVLSAELFNSAIEINVDMITKKICNDARDTKDMAAGAVLISAIGSMVIGLIIFLPKIIAILKI